MLITKLADAASLLQKAASRARTVQVVLRMHACMKHTNLQGVALIELTLQLILPTLTHLHIQGVTDCKTPVHADKQYSSQEAHTHWLCNQASLRMLPPQTVID